MNVKNRNRIDLFISLIFLIITTIGLFLRHLQPENNVLRFIIESQGNIGGVIVGSFLFIWWVNESSLKKREIIVFSVGFGLIIYEFIQLIIPWQTFDIIDIYGTLLGVAIATILNLFILFLKNVNIV